MKKFHYFCIYPTDSYKNTNKLFVTNADYSVGGTQWRYYYIQDDQWFYFDSFGGQLDEISLQLLPKPITFYNCRSQCVDRRLCGSNSSYFSTY